MSYHDHREPHSFPTRRSSDLYVLSWGALALGHAPPEVLARLDATMRNGTSFGIPTELEVELGEMIVARMPHVEMLRFVDRKSTRSELPSPCNLVCRLLIEKKN